METISGVSSAHIVLSNDDLLFEILLLLPVISILQFQLVSKRWQSLIKSSNFTHRRNQNPKIDQPSGLFIELKKSLAEYNFVRLPGDTSNSFPLHTTFPFGSNDDQGNVEIKHSCNGLLLCFIRPYKLYVYNLPTKQFKLLSEDQQHFKLGKLNRYGGVKLAFDPIKSPHYKVIYAHNNYPHDPSVEIRTYSSETSSWSVFPDRFPFDLFMEFCDGFYWDDAIHWLGLRSLHNKLNLNDMVLSTIPNPEILNGKMYLNHKLMDSRGGLFLSCIVETPSTDSREMNIYEMKNRCSEWSVKYSIDVDNVLALIPRPLKMTASGFSLRCIAVGEREEDTFIVVEVYRKLVQYKIVLKTLSKICDLSPAVVKPLQFNCFPFIPSSAGV